MPDVKFIVKIGIRYIRLSNIFKEGLGNSNYKDHVPKGLRSIALN